MGGVVEAVCLSAGHVFSKQPVPAVTLLAGQGVVGDCHRGSTVQHRSRVARDPSQPNLRQVHLVHAELLDDLRGQGFDVGPGTIGENVTTRGVDLLGLGTGTVLTLGGRARVEVTGLRNPCLQLDRHARGLLKACLDRDPDGGLVRLAGVMAVVLDGGVVRPGEPVTAEPAAGPHRPLEPV